MIDQTLKPVSNKPESYFKYAFRSIFRLLRHDPVRLLRYMNPINIWQSQTAFQKKEELRAGKWGERRAHKLVRFESAEWNKDAGIARREFTQYDDYLALQASKLDRVKTRLVEHDESSYIRFRNMFSACPELTPSHSVLCLGARLGTEVRALIDLGHLAVGIDLNPGEENSYVLPGDFHNLVFADGSFSAVYTNTMDHVFSPEQMIAEVRRVLAPNGLFIMDVIRGYDEGVVPDVDHSALSWAKADEFANFVSKIGGFRLLRHYELPDPPWTQALFIKS